MSHPQLELIVAVDSKLGFGKGGKIPWKCKEDMA
ncbi:DfrA family trimethoprim-resistant dihydrofolate reductase, partial [Salmonella enterica]|nr:DfrA family trimethoprim-resistant dihydrofolate reductase [Salmonella enterica]